MKPDFACQNWEGPNERTKHHSKGKPKGSKATNKCRFLGLSHWQTNSSDKGKEMTLQAQ